MSSVEFGTKAPTNAELVHLESLKDLSTLQIHGEEIGDDGLSHLKELKGLKLLDLSFTRVGDGGLVHLCGLNNLWTLDLSFTRVGDAGLAQIEGRTFLRDLSLRNTRIGDDGLATWRVCPDCDSNAQANEGDRRRARASEWTQRSSVPRP